MDENTTDVVQPTEGGQETPIPATSTPEGGQDSPGAESTIEALSQEVKQLSGMVKAFQSDEDRRIPAIERQVKDQSEQLEKYYKRREDGLSHDQALREDVLDQVAEQFTPTQVDASVPPTGEPAVQPTVAGEDYLSAILKMSGLTDSDPDVIALLRSERDQSKLAIAFSALAESRETTSPPNPAAALPSGGGQAVTSDTLDSVNAELQAEIAKPATNATRARIQELGKKQKELLPKK